jgi:hypothetical protein
MSLHKFAEQVAANGRGEDSLLVHMTPDEVRNLQKFAQANGTTLTINPVTGLPEAGLLSDLFKAVAPIALGAFLGPAGAAIGGGFMSAGMAGLATGGITALATGSLSRGLMAGLGAYGGAGLGESLMQGGTGALSQTAGAGLGEEAAQQAVAAKLASATPTETLAAGFNAAKANPMAFAKSNMGNIGYAASPILAAAMVPTTTKTPTPDNNNYIRQFDFNINPETGKPDPVFGMRAMTPVKASEWKDKTFEGQRERFRQENPYDTGVASLRQQPQQQPTTMATGGIVALADGGGTGGLDYQTLVSSLQNSPLTAAQRANSSPQYQATVDYTSPTVNDDMVQRAYQEVWGRAAAPWEVEAWQGVAGDATEKALSNAPIQTQVADMYRNVLGRDADPRGLANYTNQIAAFNPVMLSAGQRPDQVYADFLANARTSGELINTDPTRIKDYASAVTPYTGYQSTDRTNIVDEWVRNTLGREVTAADKQQAWYKDAFDATKTIPDFKNLYGQFQDYARTDTAATTAQKIKEATASLAARGMTEADVLRQTGKTVAQLVASDIDLSKDVFAASQLRAPGVKAGFDFNSIQNPYGNATNPGDKTYNPDGSITVTPNIPGRPPGGFSGMGQVRDAYTAGGGSLGYTSYAPKTMEEFNRLYNKQTGDSLAAYNYLMGKGAYPTKTTASKVMRPYSEAVLGVAPKIASATVAGVSDKEVKDKLTSTTAATGGLLSLAGGGAAKDTTSDYGQWLKDNNVSAEQVARSLGISLAEAKKRYYSDEAEDETSGFSGFKGYGESGKDFSKEVPSAFLEAETDEDRATRMRGLDEGLTKAFSVLSPFSTIARGLLDTPFVGGIANAFGGRQDPSLATVVDAVPTSNPGIAAAAAADPGALRGDDAIAAEAAAAEQAARDAVDASQGAAVGGDNGYSGGTTGAGNDSGGIGAGEGLAHGGLSALAQGGMSNLGSYSDGGRLLRGPGDGISDSIPAVIGKKQPARLADGEFVIPARIVSELGNGSTEAGARKLYAMMERVQRARGKTTGKNKVAANSRSDKYLPA